MGKDNLNKAIEIVSQHTGIPIKDINTTRETMIRSDFLFI